ncbi:MAG: DUF349 domain-containing protein [Myxococcota bacterium]
MWDWIRGALGMRKPEPAPSASEATEETAEAPATTEAAEASSSAPKVAKANDAAVEDKPKKRKKKKQKRRQRKQPPGWFKEDPVEVKGPTIPKPSPKPEPAAPRSLLPAEAAESPKPKREPEPEEAEAPAPRPAPAPKPAPAPAPVAANDGPNRPSPKQRDQATLAWIVVPKLEALLTELDESIADAEAPRDKLVAARSRLVREWRALKPIPPSDRDRLEAAYGEHLAKVTARIDAMVDPKVEEEKKHIAMREALIENAEGLVGLPDLRAAISQAKALQKQWRDAPRVARDVAKAQTTRFRTVMDAVFARRDEEQAARLVRLEAFADSAEALSRSDDPEKAAEAIKRLQAQWKEVGGVRGEKGDAVWTRFRTAADAVFEGRRAKREAMHAESLRARQDLIEQANRLADEGVEDPDAVIRDLQRRWRQTGHVPRESADAIWTSFKGALDRIRNPPAMDPSALGDGQETLKFNPFAGIDRDG